MKILLGFLIGFIPTFVGFMGAAKFVDTPKAVVLAEQIELTPEPSLEPTPTEIPTPLPTLSPTPLPTKKPTPKSTVSPSPTVPLVPTPTPDVWSPPDIAPLFSRYAGAYGVDQNILERLANCESHFNPNAKNGDYLGMFQFSTSTWSTYRIQMGFDANPILRTNTEESIRTAAFLLSKRGTAPWPSCL